MSVTDEQWPEPRLIVSYKSKAPLLAKNARNGAPNLLEGYFANWICGPPAIVGGKAGYARPSHTPHFGT